MSSLHGRLGGIGFCAASWHQKARDEFVGWSADARVANLGQMVNNNRFLLLPGVRVHGLASRVLDLAATRLPGDWEAAYGVRPAYTYVSPDHSGTCYREAGWKRRPTSGLPPGAVERGVARAAKPLAADWKEQLCRGPKRMIGLAPEASPSGDWAEREYGRGTHPDERNRRRMVRMGRAWEARPGQPVPVIFPNKEDQKAAYRLLSSPRVNHVLESHKECMVERCRRERVVLAVQDTTMLNYNGATSGLVPIGGGGSGTKGIAAHFGLAITTSRRPLGIFEINAAMRDDKDESESVRWLKHFDKAQEIARACPDTRVVTVCDREGDIWELLSRAVSTEAGLVVRACRATARAVRRRQEKEPLGRRSSRC